MDRGLASEGNLEWMQQEGRLYLVGTPRSEMQKWERELVDQRGWEHIRDGLEVKLCKGPAGDETFILCRSEDRRKKEAAMHQRFSERIVKALESLARRLEAAKVPADRSQVERQIGRILERSSRAAAKFQVRVLDDQVRPSGLRVEWLENQRWAQWAQLTEGTYILRSNVTEWSAEALWRTYIQLTEAEAAFRIQKTDLQIRPIWHQKQDRVLAHILVCFLGYALWKTVQGWMQRAGLGSSPRTLIEELAQIRSVDVVVPLETGRDMRLRCVVRPDQSQRDLLDRMGLRLPRRLKTPAAVAGCSANQI